MRIHGHGTTWRGHLDHLFHGYLKPKLLESVPVEVREERRFALAIRWLKMYASERRDKSMASRLASELMAAANGEGSSVKKRDDIHRMAEANKAFAHFKW